MVMVYYGARIQNQISQGQRCGEQSLGWGYKCKASLVCSPWSQDSVSLPALVSDSTHRRLPSREAHTGFGVQSFYRGPIT